MLGGQEFKRFKLIYEILVEGGGPRGMRSVLFLEEKPESQDSFLCTSPCIPVPAQSE